MATAKLYTDKSAITAADLLNDRVIPLFDGQGIKLQRILTNRGAEYCGKPENHAYQLYLAVEDMDHSKTKANHPQTNGICERFHKTLQDKCYNLEELQVDLDAWLEKYNREAPLRALLLRQDVLGDLPGKSAFGLGRRLEPRR